MTTTAELRVWQAQRKTFAPGLGIGPQRLVAARHADSVSGWVSVALEDRILRDRKLALLAAVVADYEDEFGEITVEEIARQRRADRDDGDVDRDRRARSGVRT